MAKEMGTFNYKDAAEKYVVRQRSKGKKCKVVKEKYGKRTIYVVYSTQ